MQNYSRFSECLSLLQSSPSFLPLCATLLATPQVSCPSALRAERPGPLSSSNPVGLLEAPEKDGKRHLTKVFCFLEAEKNWVRVFSPNLGRIFFIFWLRTLYDFAQSNKQTTLPHIQFRENWCREFGSLLHVQSCILHSHITLLMALWGHLGRMSVYTGKQTVQ